MKISLFQFHKGTIRTTKSTHTLPTSSNFNSIKVRLEQKKEHKQNEKVQYFNSIKVRLEQLYFII